ncbi:MAG: hypothetical protein RIQ41_368 [Candidatus Parcubacteria bacterium]|jgi:uncharacterized membrane protein
MLSIILSTLAGVGTFIALDYLWLAKIAKSFYLEKLAAHVTIENGALVPYLPAVPLVYALGIVSLWVFVLSWTTSLGQATLYGALLGFLMYGFYDLTNLATLKGYSWSLTIVDSLWGALLMGTVTCIMFLVRSHTS